MTVSKNMIPSRDAELPALGLSYSSPPLPRRRYRDRVRARRIAPAAYSKPEHTIVGRGAEKNRHLWIGFLSLNESHDGLIT